MNANVTWHTMNANLNLENAMNHSAIEHRSVSSEDIDLNVKVMTAKSSTYNCVNSKCIYDKKHFQTCAITVRSRYVKFLCHENSQSQLIFIGDYSHNNCFSCRHRREREQEPSRIPAKKGVAY